MSDQDFEFNNAVTYTNITEITSAKFNLEMPSGDATPASGPGGGFTPAQVKKAYGIDQITFLSGTLTGDGTGQTIAIVDAFGYTNAASDLAFFSTYYGLPAASLTIVGQSGGSVSGLTGASQAWLFEQALDLQWVHALAPGAALVLVQCNSASLTDLLTGVNYARNLTGVSVVCMNWAATEFSTEALYDGYCTTPGGHSGVTFVASTGDSGKPAGWPAMSKNSLAIGATALTLDGSNNWSSETGWSSSGGGISLYESQPSWQTGIVTQSSTKRCTPDMSFVGSTATQVSIYLNGSWTQVAGTSVGAACWSGLMGIIQQGRNANGWHLLDGATETLPKIYALSSSDIHDITTGNNGYAAGVGYDLVTGLGTPIANLFVPDMCGPPQFTTTGVGLLGGGADVDTEIYNSFVSTGGLIANGSYNPIFWGSGGVTLNGTFGNIETYNSLSPTGVGLLGGSAATVKGTYNIATTGVGLLAAGFGYQTYNQTTTGVGVLGGGADVDSEIYNSVSTTGVGLLANGNGYQTYNFIATGVGLLANGNGYQTYNQTTTGIGVLSGGADVDTEIYNSISTTGVGALGGGNGYQTYSQTTTGVGTLGGGADIDQATYNITTTGVGILAAGNGYQTYNITTTGVGVLGGGADVDQATYNVVATGGIIDDGYSAQLYNQITTGVGTLGGGADVDTEIYKSISTTGVGALGGGADVDQATYNVVTTGVGILTAGNGYQTYSQTTTGVGTLGGGADVDQATYNVVATGGILAAGNGYQTYSQTTTGVSVLGGGADIDQATYNVATIGFGLLAAGYSNQTYSQTTTGVGTLGGGADVDQATYNVVATGGILAAGNGYQTYSQTTTGVGTLGGGADISQATYNITTTGVGILAAGNGYQTYSQTTTGVGTLGGGADVDQATYNIVAISGILINGNGYQTYSQNTTGVGALSGGADIDRAIYNIVTTSGILDAGNSYQTYNQITTGVGALGGGADISQVTYNIVTTSFGLLAAGYGSQTYNQTTTGIGVLGGGADISQAIYNIATDGIGVLVSNNGYQTYIQIITGVGALGGGADVDQATYNIITTGGFLASGNGYQTYSQTTTGVGALSGGADVSRVTYNIVTTGGMLTSGYSYQTYNQIITGVGALGGGADISQVTYNIVTTGIGMFCNGIASVVKDSPNNTIDGVGVLCNGIADNFEIYNSIVSIGGMLAAGTGITSKTTDVFITNSGIIIDGTGVAVTSLMITPSGGLLAAGDATNTEIINVTNGVVCNGVGIIQSVYNIAIPETGVICNGFVPTIIYYDVVGAGVFCGGDALISINDHFSTASGTARTGGVAHSKLETFVSYKYGIGSIVFLQEKATKGIYEKIVIKRVFFNNGTIPIYVDTLNSFFQESELVTYDQAVALVAEYKDETIARNQDFALKFPVGKRHRRN